LSKRWAVVIGVAAAGVLVLATQLTTAAQERPREREINLLFAQTANRGTMKPIKGTPRFSLKLFGVNPQVVWFSDRPARQSGQIPVRRFTRSWAGFGFVENPPNAALTLLHARDRHDTVVVELSRPNFNRKKNRLRYTARILDEATGDLSHLNSDLDPRLRRRFRLASLFIDDATAHVVGSCVIQAQTRCVGADLSEGYMARENLTGADLTRANLTRANLSGANLTLTRLNQAVLVEANLRGATLGGTDLRGANLRGADWDEARFTIETKFCNTTMPNGRINDSNC
jgi:hypothetical protein